MNAFFYGVKTEEVDVSRFNTSNLKSISSMFENSNLREIDISNWDMSKITENNYVFYNTQNLEFLKFKKLPNETELKCFADNYFVDILRDDGVFAAILGLYDKNEKYTFKKNESYRVYLANTSAPRVKRIFG